MYGACYSQFRLYYNKHWFLFMREDLPITIQQIPVKTLHITTFKPSPVYCRIQSSPWDGINDGLMFTALYNIHVYVLLSSQGGEPPTYWSLEGSIPPASHLFAFAWFAATDMARSLPAISVKAGRCAGSGAQHCSMSLLHSGSHDAGTGGLSVLFTMPPAKGIPKVIHVLTARRNKKG